MRRNSEKQAKKGFFNPLSSNLLTSFHQLVPMLYQHSAFFLYVLELFTLLFCFTPLYPKYFLLTTYLDLYLCSSSTNPPHSTLFYFDGCFHWLFHSPLFCPSVPNLMRNFPSCTSKSAVICSRFSSVNSTACSRELSGYWPLPNLEIL